MALVLEASVLMPLNRIPGFTQYVAEELDQARRRTGVDAIYLGGSSGSNGGVGVPPGGFIGSLIQTKVAYDTTEAESLLGSSSLVDNLNHIRHRIGALEDTAGLTNLERIWLWS